MKVVIAKSMTTGVPNLVYSQGRETFFSANISIMTQLGPGKAQL